MCTLCEGGGPYEGQVLDAIFEIQQLISGATNLMFGWVPVMLLSQSAPSLCEHKNILFPHKELLNIYVQKIYSDFSCLAKSYTKD